MEQIEWYVPVAKIVAAFIIMIIMGMLLVRPTPGPRDL